LGELQKARDVAVVVDVRSVAEERQPGGSLRPRLL
jgi:hypothetical protein